MSGKDSFEILKKIFKPKNNNWEIKGYTMKYGHIVDQEHIVDEVIVSFFKGPKSYTAENMCEINSHGGNVIMRKILEICIENGAQLAEPGEFTKRAFLNGRIDLSQAESVIDIINAKSEREANEGIKQLEGFLAKEIKEIKNKILDILTNIEVSIDYPEYDTPEIIESDIREKIYQIESDLVKLTESFENGKYIKEGIKTAIIGKPNAGKSSLLNNILREERAIVTEYEGTTRDTIEEFVNIKGIPIKLIDTAGIRETDNQIEKIGIEKSRNLAKDADLVIMIIDASQPISDEDIEILKLVNNKKTIILLNKIDLGREISPNMKEIQGFDNIMEISALKGIGIEELYQKIEKMFNFNKINYDNETVITNERHKGLIKKAVNDINKAKEMLEQKMPIDIVSIGLKNTMIDLGEITGEEANEDIINEIFSRFCLGK